ncbi:MAG: glycosyltransferase family 2 protein [bacterium]|nr:glycosyltransferase family 2 protein [bacterium]
MLQQDRANRIAIVAPVHNEEDNLGELYRRLAATLEPAGVEWTLLFVDDGSTDGSLDVIRRLRTKDPRVSALVLSRNFGQEAATTAGLDYADADATILLDADLQDPPELCADMIDRWREGARMVVAKRTRREGEPGWRRAMSFLFYRLLDWLFPWKFPRDTGDFRLMDRRVVEAFRKSRQRNRLTRAVIAYSGFRTDTVEYDRPPRQAGETKYTLRTGIGLAVSALTSFSLFPLRFAYVVGLLFTCGAAIGATVVAARWFMGHTDLGNAPLILSIWFVGGVQCFLIGLIGEYVGRTHIEVQARPIYVVDEEIGAVRDDATHTQA